MKASTARFCLSIAGSLLASSLALATPVGSSSFASGGLSHAILGPWEISRQEIPNQDALSGWKARSSYVTSGVDVRALPLIPVACADKSLYPTHPQQNLKVYLNFQYATYDQRKLRAADTACVLGSKYANAGGIKYCLRADVIEYAVIADTFHDACRNFYRGIWDVSFLMQNDSMGTLFSLGRVLYQKPESQFANDMYVAQTYALSEKDFLFLSPLWEGDAVAIERLQKMALSTHSLDSKTHLYSPLGR